MKALFFDEYISKEINKYIKNSHCIILISKKALLGSGCLLLGLLISIWMKLHLTAGLVYSFLQAAVSEHHCHQRHAWLVAELLPAGTLMYPSCNLATSLTPDPIVLGWGAETGRSSLYCAPPSSCFSRRCPAPHVQSSTGLSRSCIYIQRLSWPAFSHTVSPTEHF